MTTCKDYSGFEHYGTYIGYYHYCPNCGAETEVEK